MRGEVQKLVPIQLTKNDKKNLNVIRKEGRMCITIIDVFRQAY